MEQLRLTERVRVRCFVHDRHHDETKFRRIDEMNFYLSYGPCVTSPVAYCDRCVEIRTEKYGAVITSPQRVEAYEELREGEGLEKIKKRNSDDVIQE